MIRALSVKIALKPADAKGEVFVIYGERQVGFPVKIVQQAEAGGYADIFLSASDTPQAVYLLGKLLTDTLTDKDMENAPNQS